MTKEEFKVLVMLYAANIDGNIHEDEVEQILQKTDFATFEKMRKDFRRMKDIEILSCIRENKITIITNENEKQDFIEEIKSILVADDYFSYIEAHLLRTLKRILD